LKNITNQFIEKKDILCIKKETIKNFMRNFHKLISQDRIDEIARETKFIQRNSKKITSNVFFDLAVFDDKNICTESLEQLSTHLLKTKNIAITSQALDERFNHKFVKFLKKIFQEILLLRTAELFSNFLNTKFLSYFNKILITDASTAELSNNCKDIFQGYSGSAAESAVKLQLTYDLKSGNVVLADVGDVKTSDGGYLPFLDKIIEKNDLVIRDLGYFSIKNFDLLNEKEAFYLSRLKVSTVVYVLNPNPDTFETGNIKKNSEYIKLDLATEAKALKPKEIKDIEVFVGEQKVKTRLILCKLPEEAVAKKLAHQKVVARKKQITISSKSIDLSVVNIYITNVSADILPKENIYLIYTLRWQIEIIFKILKSVFNFDKVKTVKPERILCHLYSTLIKIMLSFKIVFCIRNLMYSYGSKEISEYKAFKIIHSFLGEIKDALFYSTSKLKTVFGKIIDSIISNGMKSKNKNKVTSLEILNL
jgi:hypothetical protein